MKALYEKPEMEMHILEMVISTNDMVTSSQVSPQSNIDPITGEVIEKPLQD